MYPAAANEEHGRAAIWSTIFVALVGVISLCVFQVAFCWMLHRQRMQQTRGENLVMRRLLEFLEQADSGDARVAVYLALEQPCGEMAAARRCDDDEQTPGPDGKLPALRLTAGGDGSDEEGREPHQGADPSAQASRSADAARNILHHESNVGNDTDDEPSVAVVMGVDQQQRDEGGPQTLNFQPQILKSKP